MDALDWMAGYIMQHRAVLPPDVLHKATTDIAKQLPALYELLWDHKELFLGVQEWDVENFRNCLLSLFDFSHLFP